MPTLQRILVFSSVYPSARRPERGAFVHALVDEWRELGMDVRIVAPEPLGWRRGERWGDSSGNESRVRRPSFTSFGNIRLAGLSTYAGTQAAFTRAACRAAEGSGFTPDIVYGHFLYPAGATAITFGARHGIPCVLALGESALPTQAQLLGESHARHLLGRSARIICVSERNLAFCVDQLGLRAEQCVLAPNAANTRMFRPMDKRAVRAQLGLPEDRFIIAFTGHFIERKGPLRVIAAIAPLPEVSAIFAGQGPQQPSGEQVLFAGAVSHSVLPVLLGAADLFALPTLAEGSPNAVAEALAAGLPVLASNIDGMAEQIGAGGSTLDPHDRAAWTAAIETLMNDHPQRRRLALNARLRAEQYSLTDRAKLLLSVFQECLDARMHRRMGGSRAAAS